MIIHTRLLHFLFLCTTLLTVHTTAHAAPHPAETLVRDTTQDVLKLIQREHQPGNDANLRAQITNRVLPYFDFPRMTALAVGKNWRNATPKQQQALSLEFKRLLIGTYSNALTATQVDNVTVKPVEASPQQKDVTVNSTVLAANSSGKPIQLAYRLTDAGHGWKVYDVLIAGVSIVTTNRSTFNQTVEQFGVDGLIKQLRDRNAQLSPSTAQ